MHNAECTIKNAECKIVLSLLKYMKIMCYNETNKI